MSTAKTIYDTAIAFGMPVNTALLIVAQAKHETGDFTSKTFLQNHNCFGYKYVKGAKYQDGAGRTSTEGDPYAKYKSVVESTQEICAWLQRHIKNYATLKTPEQYANALKAVGYYGAPVAEYVHGMSGYYQPTIA